MKQLTIIDPSVGKVTKIGLSLRSNLSFNQWQELGEKLRYVEGSVLWWIGDWLNYGERSYGELYTQATDATDYGYQALADAKWIASRIEPSRRREKLPFSTHREVAVLEADQQDEILARAEQEGLTQREVRALVRDIKSIPNIPELPKEQIYRVLYADPPWNYNDTRDGLKGYTGAEDHYQTLTIQQLCELRDSNQKRVKDLASDNSVLFIWVTSPLLEDCFSVIREWGFEYKTSFVWDKVKHNFGHYNSVRHELLLIATRGSCIPDSSNLIDSVQTIERSDRHSEKPEEFRSIIDTLYVPPELPAINRIELFRRGSPPSPHWHIWGDEAAPEKQTA